MKGGCRVSESYLITKEAIKVNYAAKDWEEAINKAGELLVTTGCAEPSYSQAMVDLVKNLGPYIVIAPRVALAHARPDNGAKETGLSLVTLKHPVNFGNPENDPVELVFGLAAVDSKSHVNLLSKLAGFLEDEKNIDYLCNCKESADITNLMNSL